MISVARLIVMDVSSVRKIKHECHFSRQAQHLVMLEGDFCCSAYCNGHFECKQECHFSRQAQHLVRLEGDFCCSAYCNGRFKCEED